MRIVRSPDGTSESRLDATRLAAAMDAIGVTLGGADLHKLLEEGGSAALGLEDSGELTLDLNGTAVCYRCVLTLLFSWPS
jgi:hypothetical protein